ncbi:MAG: ribonuclease Y [Candidatus Saccharimonadales bacterium]
MELLIVAAAIGVAVGFGGKTLQTKKTLGDAEARIKKKLSEAEDQSKDVILKAKEKATSIIDESKKEEKERRQELSEIEKRLIKREDSFDKKLEDLDKRTEKVRKAEDEIDSFKQELIEIRAKSQEKLESIAKLSKAEAAERLMKMTEKDIREDLVGLVDKLKEDAKEEAEDNAKAVIVAAMERLASDVSAEKTVSSIDLPNDEMKGRIIGKEGRNIQALERATGVDIMVDDTPGVIVISSFDPVRRQVARIALEMLMKDGRIHPGRIEEVVAKAQERIDKEIVQAANDAARDVGIVGIPKEILRLVGELKFRTSYGQNVLAHSVEMAHMAGMIAEEIGANVRICKYAALIHDMGKALTHKMEGKHHHISGEMARKYGIDEEIAHAAEAHHDDVEATTPEAMVVRVVDALSAARPGARNQSTENFVQRMQELENVATSFKGIEKAYAISAGREIRIFVKPEEIDDLSSIRLARDIADKVESTLQYPGTIKVNVIRETRSMEYAK